MNNSGLFNFLKNTFIFIIDVLKFTLFFHALPSLASSLDEVWFVFIAFIFSIIFLFIKNLINKGTLPPPVVFLVRYIYHFPETFILISLIFDPFWIDFMFASIILLLIKSVPIVSPLLDKDIIIMNKYRRIYTDVRRIFITLSLSIILILFISHTFRLHNLVTANLVFLAFISPLVWNGLIIGIFFIVLTLFGVTKIADIPGILVLRIVIGISIIYYLLHYGFIKGRGFDLSSIKKRVVRDLKRCFLVIKKSAFYLIFPNLIIIGSVGFLFDRKTFLILLSYFILINLSLRILNPLNALKLRIFSIILKIGVFFILFYFAIESPSIYYHINLVIFTILITLYHTIITFKGYRIKRPFVQAIIFCFVIALLIVDLPEIEPKIYNSHINKLEKTGLIKKIANIGYAMDAQMSSCGRYLFVAGGKAGLIYRIDLLDNYIIDSIRIKEREAVRMAINPLSRELYVISCSNYSKKPGILYVISEEGFEIKEKVLNEKCRCETYVGYDKKQNCLFVTCEMGMVTRYNIPDYDNPVFIDIGKFHNSPVINYKTGVLYIANGVSIFEKNVYALNSHTGDIIKKKHVGFTSYKNTVDEKRNLVFLNRPLEGRVLILNGDSLDIEGKINTGSGPRDVDIDKKRDLLYVGNYFDGTIDIVDLRTMEVVERIMVGRWIRRVHYDQNSHRVFAVCGSGVFEIFVDMLI